MKPTKTLIFLAILTALFAVIQSGAGLFWQAEGSPFDFTTLHGEVVKIYGQGIYRYDTYFKAPINRGTDAVTLFLAVPLMTAGLLLYSRGSLRGLLLMTGVLSYLLYNAASVVLGTAYNNLFLAYTVYFSASLFAFIMAFQSVNRGELVSRLSTGVPRKGIAALLFLSAAGLLAAWLPDIIGAALQGTAPAIASYTTEVTYAIDLGIIVPASILAGTLILRRAPLGYLLSSTLLILLVIIGVVVTSQSVFQSLADIDLPIQVFVAKAASFMILALIAVGLLVPMFCSMDARKSANLPVTGTTEA